MLPVDMVVCASSAMHVSAKIAASTRQNRSAARQEFSDLDIRSPSSKKYRVQPVLNETINNCEAGRKPCWTCLLSDPWKTKSPQHSTPSAHKKICVLSCFLRTRAMDSP